MEKNCSSCKHSPVDERCKGCRGEKDGNTHWEPEPFINKPCISECVRHEEMTYEEAIEHNKNLRMYMKLSDKNQPCKFLEENYIALDMAIKALEQQPCDDWYDVPSDEMTLEQARQAVNDLRKKLAEYLEQEQKILDTIDFAIDASNGDTNYSVGFRNGLRYAKSFIDGKEPQYESCTEQQSCEDTQMIDKSNFSMEQYKTDIQSAYDCGKASVAPCDEFQAMQDLEQAQFDKAYELGWKEGREAFRQAAIDAINRICPVDTEYDCTLLDRVDVRCVLSDLPSAQLEKHTDERTKTHACVCISKQQAIDAVCRWGVDNERNGKLMITMAEAKQSIVDLLDDLPPITPQPKTGNWIENAPEYQNIYICSECGNMHLRKTNYCDQCGCRMVEPQESEDAK